MSKKHNSRMHIVALQNDLGVVTAERDALQVALSELGYCNDQQAAFISSSFSGPDGLISKDILLTESKAALAEAVSTNKRLTEDLEFQQHRYDLLGQDKAALGRTCRALVDERDALQADLQGTRKVLWAALGVALVAIAVSVGLQQGWMV